MFSGGKKLIYKVILAWRAVTSRWRVLPNTFIIGAQKSGSSFLYKNLSEHPQVIPGFKKEISYFCNLNANYTKGILWYKKFFPLKGVARDKIIIDDSVSYLSHPYAAKRIIQVVPKAKFIVILRDPIKRAFSAYQHNIRHKDRENRSFMQALKEEDGLIKADLELLESKPLSDVESIEHYAYKYRGMYDKHILQWLKHIKKEQLHVLWLEDMNKSPQEELLKITKFLEIEKFYFPNTDKKVNHNSMSYTGQLQQEEVKYLHAVFGDMRQKVQDIIMHAR